MKDKDFYKRSTHPGMKPEKKPSAEGIPANISGYPIKEVLKQGGMSTIYLGTHPGTKEHVAIKTLSPKYLKDDDVIRRFLKESEIIALADHPNIVNLYDQGNWEGGFYIAMEYIEGVSLYQTLKSRTFSYQEALDVSLEIAYALCHLHSHGVIHRDLKLENIIYTKEETIKVIDFGIAQILKEPAGSAMIGRRIVGTPIYMSPEQKRDPDSVSYPSDIYSLGIIIYELILGRTNHGKVALARMPKGVQKILSRCLQPLSTNRYPDVVALIADLSDYMNSEQFLIDRS